MAMEYKKLFEPVLLTSSPAAILAVSATPATRILKGGIIRITNTSGSAVQVTLSAGANSATNNFFPGKTVPANDYIDVQMPQLKAGDTVQGFADTPSVVNVQAIAGAYYS